MDPMGSFFTTSTGTSSSRPSFRFASLAWLGCAWLALTAPGCQLLGGRAEARIVDTNTQETLEFDAFVERLAAYDVVFFGEQHGHRGTHDLQTRTTQALHGLRPHMVLSMEHWERDVQPVLSAYLRGEIQEPEFLEGARPWGNYEEDYRPAVEWAKSAGVPVLAANAPRPLAKSAMKEGLDAVLGDPHVAASVDTSEGRYWEEFQRMLGDMASHGGGDETMLKNMYVAQCVKDDTMAESIANMLQGPRSTQAGVEPSLPLVVHWCGRAHSDYRLGTVERLAARLGASKPIAVVSIVTGDEEMPADPADLADFLWVFPD